MHKKTSLFLAAMLSSAGMIISAVPVSAATGSTAAAQPSSSQTTPLTDAQKQAYKNMLSEASEMMGHIGIANIALMHGLTKEANDNVNQALAISQTLEGQAAKFNADVLKVGKLRYHSASGDKYDYWLPMINDTFVVNEFDSEYLKSKAPKVVEEDADLVNTKVALDTKQIHDSLTRAQADMKANNNKAAQADLMNAAQSTFTEETVGEMPLATAHDNLVLARELARSKDYDGAGYALTHAKDALKDYEKTAAKSDQQQANKLSADITTLQAQIEVDKNPSVAGKSASKPSIGQSIESHVTNWIHDIESIGSKKS